MWNLTVMSSRTQQRENAHTGPPFRREDRRKESPINVIRLVKNIQKGGDTWILSRFRSNYAQYLLDAYVIARFRPHNLPDGHAEYAYFFFYSFVRSSYIKRLTRKLPPGSKLPPLSTAAELLLGALAGALGQIFTIPVSVIATRQQVGRVPSLAKRARLIDTSPTPSEIEEETDDSFLGVAREIIEEEGVTGLWLGLKPGLALTVNPAITYGVYERLKSLLLFTQASNAKLSPGMSFLVGAFSKTLATVVSSEHCYFCG
jgi:hypothetical protein